MVRSRYRTGTGGKYFKIFSNIYSISYVFVNIGWYFIESYNKLIMMLIMFVSVFTCWFVCIKKFNYFIICVEIAIIIYITLLYFIQLQIHFYNFRLSDTRTGNWTSYPPPPLAARPLRQTMCFNRLPEYKHVLFVVVVF
jgi:hypothetical protein